jgi:hypothetical protein
MEEEKKEECCHGNKHNHKCCGHKLPKLAILIVAAFFIFSLGFWAGSNNRADWRSDRDFDGRGFNVMMESGNGNQKGGCRFNEESDMPATCPMMLKQNQAESVSVSPSCPMQANNVSVPVNQVKPVMPVK